ncbi:MAG: biotin transporter BioY [Chloroflexota bacterium]|nr:biotin transporter BioY [Chloroflexota bacterium]
MITTYADLLRPQTQRLAWAYDLALVTLGTALIAVSAQFAVRLPFSPVPVTGQTLMVLLIGASLGRKRGTATLLAYLAEGLVGLPVFAQGGLGWAYLLGPTGGYLFGMVAAAYLVGWLAERGWDRKPSTTAVAMLGGNLAIYALGVTWLALFTGWNAALPLGLLPFIPGDLLKIVLATLLLPAGWKLLGK